MQTVLLVENLKPLLETQSCTLFTHSCISLCTCGRDFAHIQRAKSSTKNDASEHFKTDFTILLILRLKRTGDKMLPWGAPISCPYVSDRVDPALTWNSRSDRSDFHQWKLANGLENQGRKDRTVYRVSTWCRKLFQDQRKWQERALFWQKHYECNYQIEPDDLQCYGFSRKPHCSEASKPLDSKTHINRLFTILSIVLHKRLVKAIGLQLLGSEESLPGLILQLWWLLSKRAEKFRIPKWSKKNSQQQG